MGRERPRGAASELAPKLEQALARGKWARRTEEGREGTVRGAAYEYGAGLRPEVALPG